uniref:Uncharacterized protein n=1 Tax=Oryza barthii TaxID=65489 RepID=A0A0D3FUM4_9ORYZ
MVDEAVRKVDVVDVAEIEEPMMSSRAVGRAWGAVEWSWMHGRASWTKVREDVLETMTVTRSRQLLR